MEQEKTNYPRLRKYLNDGIYQDNEGGGVYPDEYELQKLVKVVLDEVEDNQFTGYHNYRLQYTSGKAPIERAFAEHWKKMNQNNYGFGSSGLLQELLTLEGKRVIQMTERDRRISSTVIQWLGTNIGFSFLENVMKDVGYKIVKND